MLCGQSCADAVGPQGSSEFLMSLRLWVYFSGKRKPVLKIPKEVFEQPPPAAV